MTKEETLAYIKAYLDGDTAIGNIIPLRSVLESAIKYLSEPSLPSDLDEAAFSYENDLWESGFKECGYTPQEVRDAFKAGAEWMNWQDRKIWNSSIRSVPEGDKSQILSFDEEGYFYLNRKPHPDSVGWCFAKELLPIRKKQ